MRHDIESDCKISTKELTWIMPQRRSLIQQQHYLLQHFLPVLFEQLFDWK